MNEKEVEEINGSFITLVTMGQSESKSLHLLLDRLPISGSVASRLPKGYKCNWVML